MKFAIAFVSIALAGCAATAGESVDYDQVVDFSSYQAFAWVSEHPMKLGPVIADPRETLEEEIMAAVRSNLQQKGMRYSEDPAEADFLVSFTVGSREKVNPDSYPAMDKEAGGRWGWGTAFGGAHNEPYTQGVLAIDIFDAAERRPVWHGVTGKRIDESDKNDPQALIEGVVATILADFPPRQN